MDRSRRLDGDPTMDTTELLHALPFLAPSRPNISSVSPRPPFYSRTCVQSGTSPRTAVGSRDHAGVASSIMSSRRMVPYHHLLEGMSMSSRRANHEEEHREREWRNRNDLMCASEESLRLREEMVLLKKFMLGNCYSSLRLREDPLNFKRKLSA